GLSLIGVAVVLMASARTWRRDTIAGIDAVIVGIGAGVVLAAFVWPDLREEELARGGALLAVGSGLLAAFLVGAATRLGVTGASRDAAGIREVVMEAARRIAGDGLRYVAWITVNERGAMYPTEILGPVGPMERADSTVDLALQHLDKIGERPVRLGDGSDADV